MSRMIMGVAVALGWMAIAAQAQETTIRSETESSGGQVRTVTYTGCVQTGTQSRTYILDKVVPLSRTTTTHLPSGNSATATTYVLVPGERVEIEQHVGHKVEVTGTLIPAGEVTTETEIEVEREDGEDTETREEVETDNATPQFRVTSIKMLAERC